MKEKLKQIRDLIDEILVSLEAPAAVAPEPEPQRPAVHLSDDFVQLKELLDSPDWPAAVFAAQIADESSERDKEERAEGIAEIMLPPFRGKKFLDFGCGEGHVARYVGKEAASSVGYDPTPANADGWEEKRDGCLLTSDFGKVESEGPYDLILLYDVLDHCTRPPAEVLSMAASVLSPDGRILLRCHPWCGRHGGHAYRKINKAFVHLVFSDEEMAALGLHSEHNNKVTRPLSYYSKAIEDAGLKKESEPEMDSQDVEDFFRDTPIVSERILKNWGVKEWSTDPPQFQMSQCFLDYVLKK